MERPVVIIVGIQGLKISHLRSNIARMMRDAKGFMTKFAMVSKLSYVRLDSIIGIRRPRVCMIKEVSKNIKSRNK